MRLSHEAWALFHPQRGDDGVCGGLARRHVTHRQCRAVAPVEDDHPQRVVAGRKVVRQLQGVVVAIVTAGLPRRHVAKRAKRRLGPLCHGSALLVDERDIHAVIERLKIIRPAVVPPQQRHWQQATRLDQLTAGQVGADECGSAEIRTRGALRPGRNAILWRTDWGIPDQARERLIPQMNTEGLIAAIYSPQSGYADPTSATHGFANRAREQGATIRVGVDVTGILLDGERIRGVRTSDGEVRTDTVVCAAGAWSG